MRSHPHPPDNIKLNLCRPRTDFGQGFYTTTSEHQARQWANQRCRRILAPRGSGPTATVLRFAIDRDALADLHHLAFVRETADFWNLVHDCRLGFPPHQRTGSRQRAYDVVYGPVSLWQQTLVIADCDQISFHTARALALLPAPVIHAQAAGAGGLF